MARPRKQTAAKRHHVISFRLTPEEHANLAERAARTGQNLGDFVRASAFKSRVVVSEAPPALPVEVLAELNRIGVNLNQIARVANATGNIPPGLPPLLFRLNAFLDKALFGKD